MNQLTKEDFIRIIKNTPLVAIDLIIENEEHEILLGWRKNLPAKGYWFVPGGRILKDETFPMAFQRITKNELGTAFSLSDASFLGVYEHIYPGENAVGIDGIGTHYIVIAYRMKTDSHKLQLPEEQHAGYRWSSIDELLDDPNAHLNTKNYFNGYESFSEL
jgi:colanic acid biosynthesis protein WcaH